MGMKQTYLIRPPVYHAYKDEGVEQWKHNDPMCELRIVKHGKIWYASFDFHLNGTGMYAAPSLTAAKNYLTKERRKLIAELLNPVEATA